MSRRGRGATRDPPIPGASRRRRPSPAPRPGSPPGHRGPCWNLSLPCRGRTYGWSTHPGTTHGEGSRGLSQSLGIHLKLREECPRTVQRSKTTSKIKAHRVHQAVTILEGVDYERCPKCGAGVKGRIVDSKHCTLCLTASDSLADTVTPSGNSGDVVRRDLNDRIDQISDAIERRKLAAQRAGRELKGLRAKKRQLDERLQGEIERYDSAFVDSMRELEREIATLRERKRYFEKLQEMPDAVDALENEAGALQGTIDNLRSGLKEERSRLREADAKVATIASHFKSIMRNVQFPGVSEGDRVVLDSRNWQPTIQHSTQRWGFWDAGSGGKKTLFNVCYALAIHAAGVDQGLPVPNILIIDSPTKNISEDENPDLVRSLYREIYRLASAEKIQFLLIDSDLVPPVEETRWFQHKHMAGRSDAPSLISYYEGP